MTHTSAVQVTEQAGRAPGTAFTRLVRAHPLLLVALVLGTGFKVALLVTGSVSFNSDEAILALMARHILQGEFPLFFWGQAYMGSLDAYLIAASFAVLGQTVLAVRLVHLALYAGILVTTYALAYRASGNGRAAAAAALLVAMPPVMVSLYTTASLGNYIVTLLLDNLILLLGWALLSGRRQGAGWWLLLGLLAGLGWWGMALIVTALAPLAVLMLLHYRRRLPLGRIGLAGVGFAVGAAPWFIGLLANSGEVFGALVGTGLEESVATSGLDLGLPGRALSLVVFNLPALFGLRPAWSVEWTLLPAGVLVTTVYLTVLLWSARRAASREADLKTRYALASLTGGWLVLMGAFLFSPFGIDPTGRYLLPLYPLLAVLVGLWLADIARTERPWLLPAVLGLLLAYNLYGNLRAVLADPLGLTTQFDHVTHLSHEHDRELMAFLDDIDVDRAYSNYWVTYRFAFLTHEWFQAAPVLPYKADLSYTNRDDRYPAYTASVRAAERAAYITSNHPALDDLLRERFAERGIEVAEQQIGPYTVFYDLPGNVPPEALDLPWAAQLEEAQREVESGAGDR